MQSAELRRRPPAGDHIHLSVPETRRCLVGEVRVQCPDALFPHRAAVRIVEKDRAFQQVLVIGVDPAADVARGARPLPRLHVDLLAHESDLRTPGVESDERPLGLVVEHGLVRELRERAEFQEKSPDLRGIRARALRLPGLQVHVHVGHSRRRVEYGKQPRPEVAREAEQSLVARHLVPGEQTPENTDRDLEVLHRDVLVEREVLDDERSCPRGLVREAHQDHRVERVDGSHEERRAGVPVAHRPADGPPLVVAPGVFVIRAPGEEKFFPHACGHSQVARLGSGGRGGRAFRGGPRSGAADRREKCRRDDSPRGRSDEPARSFRPSAV